MRTSRGSLTAFSLIELLVVIATIALLISILLPALGKARQAARLTLCSTNLQQFSRAYSSYANDFKEFISALNGEINDPDADRQHTEHPVIARQAQHIINTYDKRRPSAIAPFKENAGTSIAEQYEHLALIGYASQDSHMPIAVCPEDKARLEWRSKPFTTTAWTITPRGFNNRSNMTWLPYSASYQLTPVAAAYSFFIWDGISWAAYSQSSAHDLYNLYKVRFGKRRITHIFYPANKVAMMDSQQRHSSRNLFFAYPEAKQPLLFWDGSVSVRTTADSNEGWHPQLPEKPGASKFKYAYDQGFESPPVGDSDVLLGHYRWTRGGLRGVDFHGSEIHSVLGESRQYYD